MLGYVVPRVALRLDVLSENMLWNSSQNPPQLLQIRGQITLHFKAIQNSLQIFRKYRHKIRHFDLKKITRKWWNPGGCSMSVWIFRPSQIYGTFWTGISPMLYPGFKHRFVVPIFWVQKIPRSYQENTKIISVAKHHIINDLTVLNCFQFCCLPTLSSIPKVPVQPWFNADLIQGSPDPASIMEIDLPHSGNVP